MKKTLTLSCLFLFTLFTVFAQDQEVTSNADDGAGSLRQAIADVGDGENITFNLPAGSETITILSELAIGQSLTIDGANTAGSGTQVTVKVTTPGTSPYRVFNISAGTVHIDNLIMQGGAPVDDNGGGVILSKGAATDLHLDGVIVENGAPTSVVNGGGGIYFEGSCTINNSLIQDNITSAFYNGGGICQAHEAGPLEITNSTLKNNQSTGGFASLSGAISIGEITTGNIISNCTFESNHAALEGGAMYLNLCELTINNSTFYGNSSNTDGGAIYIDYVNGTEETVIALNSVSIVNNTATGEGDGIYFMRGALTIQNCLLGNNGTEDYNRNETESNTLTDNGYNIVEVPLDDFTDGLNNNIVGEQADLFGTGISTQTLADNGGPTQTLAIEAGSVAIHVGFTSLTTDQRGEDRGTPPTIGAFEYPDGPTTITWTGDTDSDWATAANWDLIQLPHAADNVIIPTGLTNYPIISSGTNAVCHDIDVASGASLIVNGNLDMTSGN